MGYWSKAGGAPSSPTKLVAAPTFDAGPGRATPTSEFADVGKTSLNLSDLGPSIEQGVGNVAGFFGDVGKGATDFIGGLGIPGGPNLGDIPEVVGGAVGTALGAVGSFQLPPNDVGYQPTLSEVPGALLDVLTTPGRAVERTVAGRRTEGIRHFLEQGLSYEQIRQVYGVDVETINAIDSGATIDEIANDMVARGAGFSANPIENLAGQIVLDPLNLIAPGLGKAAGVARGAGLSIRAGETVAELGLSRSFLGTAYNGLAKGLSTAGSATVGRVVGPATAGVFHALGSKPYRSILRGLDRVAADAAARFDDALARGTRQFTPATIARDLSDEAELALKIPGRTAEEALERFPRGEELQEAVSTLRPRAVREKDMIRRTEEMAQRVVPDFHGISQTDMAAETVRKLAHISGISEEDALRALGGKVNVAQARHVHLAFYGRAGSDLSKAIAASAHAKNIDPERLTILAPQTLTDERAEALLKLMATGDPGVVEAVERYEILTRKFHGDWNWAKVREYIKNLQANDALPHQVKLPKGGENALPGPLSDWRKAYAESGYEIGFGPVDGWKAIIDDTGEVIITDPFVHFIDEAAPLTVRNQLGRFVDSLMRGTSQTKIVQTAKGRFLAQTAEAGVADADAERIFGRILDETKKRRITPRAFDAHEYETFFEEALGAEGYRAFRANHSPVFTVMRAFEGNWRQIGLTQKLTGRLKTTLADVGNFPAAIAEQLYPKLKFKYRPVFQLQELFEAPFFRVLRGIGRQTYDDPASKVMIEMAELSPEMRYTWEAGATNFLAGSEVAAALARRGPIGRTIARIVPKGGVIGVKERARIAQVFTENGEYFANTINDISPRLWKTMTDAYGTTNPNAVAKAFITERFRLIDDAMGDLVKAFVGKSASADEETVMQGFLEAWRQSSKQAFATQYFRPTRGFLERTLNHPYLALYPMSYMWGKVLPELVRFLVFRPFGLRAPLVGLAAYTRVREAIIEEQVTNPDFAAFIKDNPDSLNFLSMLLPGTPEDIPVNLPAWMRHLSRDIQGGKNINRPWIEREAIDTGVNATPLRDIRDALRTGEEFVGIGQNLVESLTKAAAEFDGIFGPQRTP
jgi:hypothetical protein